MTLIGQRSNPSAELVPPPSLDAFRDVPVSMLSDVTGSLHGTRALTAQHRAGVRVGTAVTVKTRPGDNLALRRCYELLRPGDWARTSRARTNPRGRPARVRAVYGESGAASRTRSSVLSRWRPITAASAAPSRRRRAAIISSCSPTAPAQRSGVSLPT